ncbi:MAG: hypothetical protein AABP62_31240 [Planctomycetota bacterium]
MPVRYHIDLPVGSEQFASALRRALAQLPSPPSDECQITVDEKGNHGGLFLTILLNRRSLHSRGWKVAKTSQGMWAHEKYYEGYDPEPPEIVRDVLQILG